MAEILRFQGINFVPENNGVDADREVRYKIQKMKKGITLQKEDHEKAVEPKRAGHRCANMPPGGKEVMASRRRSSGSLVHQKPLFAGMTNTQRLRLARVNPKLLLELEAKEVCRRNEFRASRMSRIRAKQNVLTNNQQNADETDSLERRPINVSRTTEYVDESRESTARYKCPVPTPRMSKMFVADKDFADVDASRFGTKTYTVGHKRREPQPLEQSSSEENFEFTLPAMKGENETDRSTHCEQPAPTSAIAGSESAGMQAATHLKPNTVGADYSEAGQTPSICGDASAGSAQLEATDAGGVLSLEDLGLRKIVDHYSGGSDDDGDKTVGSYDDKELKDRDAEYYSAEDEDKSDHNLPVVSEKYTEPELLLRKVVNQFSDVSEGEERDVEYDYDFEDTPNQSLMTASSMNSSASSILDSTVHRRIVSPTGNQDAGSNVKMSDHSGLISRIGEQCID